MSICGLDFGTSNTTLGTIQLLRLAGPPLARSTSQSRMQLGINRLRRIPPGSFQVLLMFGIRAPVAALTTYCFPIDHSSRYNRPQWPSTPPSAQERAFGGMP